MKVPVFINCRDRLTSLLALVDWLERAACEDIHLVDNSSSYEPLLDYYENTSHEVVRLGANVGQQGAVEVDAAREISVPGPFVVSDPDIVPIEECPLDAIDYFSEVLEQYPDYLKVGFGLKIDDLPDHYRHKSTVVAWESVCWKQPLATLRRADRHHLCPIPEARELRPAIRTGHPYLARHTTWYLDDSELPEDERHYRVHGDLSVINWGRDDIPGWLARKVKKRKTDSDV